MRQNEAEITADSGFSTDDRIRLTRLRRELLRALPTDIRRARKAYHRVASEAASVMDAKGFVNHQAACKAALAHVESLIKLLRWVCDEDLSGGQPAGKGGMIDSDGKPGAGVDTTENGVNDAGEADAVSQLILAARHAMQEE
ncbi:hypothetical protein [Thalassospira mesophila]|uniref:hypothetical protein n=1 Tax=Thalassospira mesophila TaxID=1293891 RepID=UPI000A1E8471|nr:hypothetical protein [Thalassospira mesophila]